MGRPPLIHDGSRGCDRAVVIALIRETDGQRGLPFSGALVFSPERSLTGIRRHGWHPVVTSVDLRSLAWTYCTRVNEKVYYISGGEAAHLGASPGRK
jgi:hypothetical protein